MRLFALFALFCFVVYAIDVDCKGTVTDEKQHRSYEFDLSGIHHNDSTPVDLFWYRSPENNIYYLNFCGQSSAGCESGDTSVCIRIPDSHDFKFVSGGKTSTQTFSLAEDPKQKPSSSVTVTYSDGDKCGAGYYKTKIYVNCQETANPGYIYDMDDSNECEVTLYMWSYAGCGKEVPYVSSSSSSSSMECGGVVSDVEHHRSYKFDLSSLYHDETTYIDTLWYRTADNVIYYFNFCGQTASACESDDTSVCIRIPDGDVYKYLSGGKTSTQTLSLAEDPSQTPDSSVTVTFSDGDKCGDGNYKTKVYVNCQQDAVPGYFYDIQETSECEATLYMWSAAGCGKEVPYVDPSSSASEF